MTFSLAKFGFFGWLALLPLATLPQEAWAQEVEQQDQQQLTSDSGEGEDEGADPIPHDAIAQKIIERTNAFRNEQQLEPVQPDEQLMATAEYFAQYMARHDKYGHRADGQRPSERATEHGYEYCLVTENIAHLFSSESLAEQQVVGQFVEGWKESPGHRENMLDADATETGVAVAQSAASGYYYAVQMFGRPRSQALKFEIVNRADTPIEYTLGEQRMTLPPRYTVSHERCRQGPIVFHLGTDKTATSASGEASGAEEETAKDDTEPTQQVRITPENGARLVVARVEGQLRVKRQ